MPDFRLKAAVQGAVSRLPGSTRANALFQRFVTRRLRMSDLRLDRKWNQVQRHLAHLAHYGVGRESGFTAVELGTGWYPVVPVALALQGAHQVYTLDRTDLLSERRVLETLQAFVKRIEAGKLDGVDASAAQRLSRALGTGDGGQALHSLGITPVVTDAADFSLPTADVDLFLSNNTLEHVPGPAIEGIFEAFARCARETAIMSHFIDMADHYALFDKSISVLNYLRYSERAWRVLNNDLHFQNRLRLSDYRSLHERSGWTTVFEEPRAVEPGELAKIPVAKCFQGRTDEDLRTYDVWMVSRPTIRR